MLSLRNQVLRQEGVNSVPYQGGKRESIDYVSLPITKGGEGEYSSSPPDKGGKGGLNALIVLYSVFYVNILFIN